MSLLKFGHRTCKGMMLLTAFASLLSGALNAGLIGMVNHVLNRPGGLELAVIFGFAGLGLGKELTGLVTQVLLARYSQGAIAGLRQDLVRRILAVPFRYLEQVCAHRTTVALIEDVLNVAQALLAIP